MKSLVLVASLICLFALPSMAQFGLPLKLPIVAGDTIVNTGTVTKFVTSLSTGYQGVYIQALITKVGSVTAAGTVQMQVSMDNVNWVSSGSAFTITNVATQVGLFPLSFPVPPYVRLLYTGSGTETLATVTSYVIRRESVTIAN